MLRKPIIYLKKSPAPPPGYIIVAPLASHASTELELEEITQFSHAQAGVRTHDPTVDRRTPYQWSHGISKYKLRRMIET